MSETREITIMIDSDLDDELTEYAKSTGSDKQTVARAALIEWLDEQEDIRDAERIIAERKPRISLTEAKKILDLDD